MGGVGAGAGAATGGGGEVVGLVSVSGVALDPPHAVLSAIAAIVKRRMNRRVQGTGRHLRCLISASARVQATRPGPRCRPGDRW